jgi:uncharacterized protein
VSLAANVLLFGRMLRRAGLDIHHGRLLDAVRALEWVNVGSRTDTASALRSLLVHDRDEIARFDRAFELFFKAHRPPAPGLPLFSLGERPRVVARPAPGAPIQTEFEGVQAGSAGSTRAVGAWSATGVSRTKDFGEFTARELERARALLEQLPWSLGRRRTRRWQRASSGAPDMRRVLRRSVMIGDFIDLPRRARREMPRPIVLLGDVSGSMERYSRVLAHFVYGLAQSATRIEVFLFATRLTRVTQHMRARRGGDALAGVAREVRDWGGGTRIGEGGRGVSPPPAPPYRPEWSRRAHRIGRVGSGRSRAPQPGARARAAQLPATDLAQPAAGLRAVRAAHTGHALGAAARGRLPSGAQSRQSRTTGRSPARAAGPDTPPRVARAPPGSDMDLNAAYDIHAPSDRVWDLLMDIDAIGRCLPGSRGLRPIGPDRYEVELGVTVAAIAGSFKGTVALEDKDPPHAYTLVLEGNGRQGFIKGRARVTLVPDGDLTRVQIAARAEVGGMIARVGQRLLEGVARTMMDRFYACLAKQVEQGGGHPG